MGSGRTPRRGDASRGPARRKPQAPSTPALAIVCGCDADVRGGADAPARASSPGTTSRSSPCRWASSASPRRAASSSSGPAGSRPQTPPRRLRQATAALAACSLPAHAAQPAGGADRAVAFDAARVLLRALLRHPGRAPFFFSGIVVCLALTRAAYPVGPTYAADLLGAASGCFARRRPAGALDGRASARCSRSRGLVFGAAALFASRGGCGARAPRRLVMAGAGVLAAGLANALTLTASSPCGSRGRSTLARTCWPRGGAPSPASPRIKPTMAMPAMWGASPVSPDRASSRRDHITIDHDAGTGIVRLPDDRPSSITCATTSLRCRPSCARAARRW